MASVTPDLPELHKEGAEVVDATIHLLDEEMEIAERLERKAREQWQLVAFVAPIAIGGALTAAGVKGVGALWIIAIGLSSLVTLVLLVWAMLAGSDMANAQEVEAINPALLDAYLDQLSKDHGEQSEAQIRADLARNLLTVARSRAEANDIRRVQLASAVASARLTCFGAVIVLVLAALAVMVNA